MPRKATRATDRRPGLMASLSPSTAATMEAHQRPNIARFLSSRHIGLGSIFAGRNFVVPTPVLVFVRDGCRLTGGDLFLRRMLRDFAGQFLARTAVAEDTIY